MTLAESAILEVACKSAEDENASLVIKPKKKALITNICVVWSTGDLPLLHQLLSNGELDEEQCFSVSRLIAKLTPID